MTAKRFRIAFSFAGEKRAFAAKVAALLAKRFGKDAILYDKFSEAACAHADLGLDLPELYHDDSDLVVAVLCRDYEKKEWCGLEWRAIHALIKERKSSDVMLCRFDQAKVNGLFSTAGLEIFTKLGSPSLATARSTLSDCRLAFALERLNHA